jgi:hypothetical protein
LCLVGRCPYLVFGAIGAPAIGVAADEGVPVSLFFGSESYCHCLFVIVSVCFRFYASFGNLEPCLPWRVGGGLIRKIFSSHCRGKMIALRPGILGQVGTR